MIVCPVCSGKSPDTAKHCTKCGTWLVDKGVVRRRSVIPTRVSVTILGLTAVIAIGVALALIMFRMLPEESVIHDLPPRSATSVDKETEAPRRIISPFPEPPIVAVGQSAQFKGAIVYLRRAWWDGAILYTVWVIYNNGDKKVSPWAFLLTAEDQTGNSGDFEFFPATRLKPEESNLPSFALTDLWPGQQGLMAQAYKFGPLSRDVKAAVSLTFVEGEQISRQTAKWTIPDK